MPTLKPRNVENKDQMAVYDQHAQLPVIGDALNTFAANFREGVLAAGGDVLAQFQQLEQAKKALAQMQAQIQSVQWQHEAYIMQMLRKQIVGKHPEFFADMISIQYPVSKELFEKCQQKLNKSFNYLGSNILFQMLPSFEGKPELYIASNSSFCEYGKCDLGLDLILEKHSYRMSGFSSNKALMVTRELLDALKSRGYIYHLSSNPYILWTKELVEELKDKWDWNKLIENKGLPWSTEWAEFMYNTMPEKKLSLSKRENGKDVNYAIHHDEVLKYLIKIAQEMENNMSHISICTAKPLTEEYISANLTKLHWYSLSQNKALPFNMDFILRFANHWHWDILAGNRGMYEKVFEPVLNDAIVEDLLLLCCPDRK